MDFNLLRLDQLSVVLQAVQVPARPRGGWVSAIRSGLGMTTRQFAERLGVGQSTVVALEKSEAAERISLQNLRRAADALDCELHYVLIPRRPLKEQVERRAEYIAGRTIDEVMHTMSLEDQAPSSERASEMKKKEKELVLAGRWSKLWER